MADPCLCLPARYSARRAPSAALVFINAVAYCALSTMKPIINVEEKIDRVVGRRTLVSDPLSVKSSNKASSISWRKALGGVRVPRGVHRFRTHEEAEEWLWKMIARPRGN